MNAKRNSTSQEQLTILMSIDDFKQIESLLIEKRIPFSINYMTKQAIEIPIEKIEKREVLPQEPIEYPNIIGEKLEQVVNKFVGPNFEAELPSIDTICEELNMRESTFKRAFKQYYGVTLHQYYMMKKMDHAANLIRSGYTITSVSKIIGYAHPIKFTKMFQKHFGVSPKKYQQFQKNLSLEKLRDSLRGVQKSSGMN